MGIYGGHREGRIILKEIPFGNSVPYVKMSKRIGHIAYKLKHASNFYKNHLFGWSGLGDLTRNSPPKTLFSSANCRLATDIAHCPDGFSTYDATEYPLNTVALDDALETAPAGMLQWGFRRETVNTATLNEGVNNSSLDYLYISPALEEYEEGRISTDTTSEVLVLKVETNDVDNGTDPIHFLFDFHRWSKSKAAEMAWALKFVGPKIKVIKDGNEVQGVGVYLLACNSYGAIKLYALTQIGGPIGMVAVGSYQLPYSVEAFLYECIIFRKQATENFSGFISIVIRNKSIASVT